MSETTRDPHTSLELKAPYLSGQESKETLEQAVKDLGGNLSKFRRSNGDRFLGNVVSAGNFEQSLLFVSVAELHMRHSDLGSAF
jgi:hypothetical protein